jgi:hypothetical protein
MNLIVSNEKSEFTPATIKPAALISSSDRFSAATKADVNHSTAILSRRSYRPREYALAAWIAIGSSLELWQQPYNLLLGLVETVSTVL